MRFLIKFFAAWFLLFCVESVFWNNFVKVRALEIFGEYKAKNAPQDKEVAQYLFFSFHEFSVDCDPTMYCFQQSDLKTKLPIYVGKNFNSGAILEVLNDCQTCESRLGQKLQLSPKLLVKQLLSSEIKQNCNSGKMYNLYSFRICDRKALNSSSLLVSQHMDFAIDRKFSTFPFTFFYGQRMQTLIAANDHFIKNFSEKFIDSKIEYRKKVVQ